MLPVFVVNMAPRRKRRGKPLQCIAEILIE